MKRRVMTIDEIIKERNHFSQTDYTDDEFFVTVDAEDLGFCKDEVDRCIIFVTKTQILLFTVSVKEK